MLPNVWSNVAYLTWQATQPVSRAPKQNLRYVVMLGIQDAGTIDIINQLSLAVPWPGATVSTWTFSGQALIGSPCGSALAWMIVQHNVWGIKVITSITVWQDADGSINMLQELGPSPDPSVPELPAFGEGAPPNPPYDG